MSQDTIAAANEMMSARVRAQDAAGTAALYTEDGWFLQPNGETLKGRPAITKFFQATMDEGIRGLDLETVELCEQGDTAQEVGNYKLLDSDGNAADVGKYIVLWKRIDGRWFLHRDIINSNLPAQAE